uniref:SKA complex subunit 1 n=1 Tax=Ursus americanus TaxID=9643 RepID=A0A452RYU6_URSAM
KEQRLTSNQLQNEKNKLAFPVVSKYKILHQPKKSKTSMARKFYDRFIDEETEYQSCYFIVKANIKEFTDLKTNTGFPVVMSFHTAGSYQRSEGEVLPDNIIT